MTSKTASKQNWRSCDPPTRHPLWNYLRLLPSVTNGNGHTSLEMSRHVPNQRCGQDAPQRTWLGALSTEFSQAAHFLYFDGCYNSLEMPLIFPCIRSIQLCDSRSDGERLPPAKGQGGRLQTFLTPQNQNYPGKLFFTMGLTYKKPSQCDILILAFRGCAYLSTLNNY